MTDNTDQNGFVQQLQQYFPADLTVMLLVTMATVAAVLIPAIEATPLPALLAAPFLLFVPGYAIVAALFPQGAEATSAGIEATTDALGPQDRARINETERVTLSFGVSLAVSSIIGLLLSATSIGVALEPVVLSVAGVSTIATLAASYRRAQLPESDRLVVPYREQIQSGGGVFSGHESRLDLALTIAAVVSVVLVVSSVGYAFAVPQQADSFTEFYLVTEQDDGELVADEYPTEFTLGESQPLVVGIGNHEHRTVEYSLVVELQEVTVENDTVTVHDSEQLLQRQPTLSDGETVHEEVQITLETEGEQLRLAFMLFKGAAPSDPTIDNAYRETHLWIDVSDDS